MVTSILHTCRIGLMVLLIAMTSIATGLYVIVHWTEKQILTTDNWVALVAPLPKEPVVSNALGTYVSTQIFAAVPVQEKISEALPPRAAFLAGPLTSQLQTITTATTKKAVASDGFQTLWSGANRIAVNRLVGQARGETPALQERINERFTIDLGGMRGQLRSALGTTAQAIPALEPAATNALDLSVDLQARAQRVHQAIRTIDYAAAVLPLCILASFLSAMALSRQRRRMAVHIAMATMAVLLFELIAIKVAHQRILDQVANPANIPAVTYIYDVVVAWLRHMVYWTLGFAAVVLLVCVLFGNAAWARALRAAVRFDRIAAARPAGWWLRVRTGVRRYQGYIYGGLAMLVLLYVAFFLTITTRSVVQALLVGIAAVAAVRIVATPPEYQRAGIKS